MAISTFLQQLESALTDKPEALAIVTKYRSDLETADAQSDKDKLILLQDQMHNELAAALNVAIDPQNPASITAPTSPLLIGETSKAVNQFQMWLDRIGNGTLSSTEKAKLIDMAQGYDEAAKLAELMDPNVTIKPLNEVLVSILQFSPTKLKEIAQFGKPILLITPENTFLNKVQRIDENKKYQGQEDSYVSVNSDSPFETVKDQPNVSISIVDSTPRMPHIDGISEESRFDMRKELFKKHYEKKGMRLISAHEYAVLMQRSLCEYEKTGSSDTSKILDFDITMTCLDDEYLSDSPLVACGCFSSKIRRVRLTAYDPDATVADLRGRPSVQIMVY